MTNSATKTEQVDNRAWGVSLYIGAVFTLAVMDTAAKWISADFPVGQMLFFRALFGFLPVIAIYWFDKRNGVPTSLLRVNLPGQIFRGLSVVLITLLFFIAVKELKLTDATAIAMSGPIMMVILGITFLKETARTDRIVCALVGFVGVLLILRPTSDAFSLYGLAAFGSAVFYAFAAIFTRRLTQTDGFFQISFWSTLILLVSGLLFFPFESWVMPEGLNWLVIAILGTFGGVSNILFVTAFRHAEVSLLAPFDYSIFLWAILFGFVFFSELPAVLVLLGASLIAVGGVYIARQPS